jgi:hypothetical protein
LVASVSDIHCRNDQRTSHCIAMATVEEAWALKSAAVVRGCGGVKWCRLQLPEVPNAVTITVPNSAGSYRQWKRLTVDATREGEEVWVTKISVNQNCLFQLRRYEGRRSGPGQMNSKGISIDRFEDGTRIVAPKQGIGCRLVSTVGRETRAGAQTGPLFPLGALQRNSCSLDGLHRSCLVEQVSAGSQFPDSLLALNHDIPQDCSIPPTPGPHLPFDPLEIARFTHAIVCWVGHVVARMYPVCVEGWQALYRKDGDVRLSTDILETDVVILRSVRHVH